MSVVCMCVCLVAESYLTLFDTVDYSTPGSSVHGISQARIQEWVAISFSRGSSWPKDLNPRLLNWQVDSLPLSHLGSPLSQLYVDKKKLSRGISSAE